MVIAAHVCSIYICWWNNIWANVRKFALITGAEKENMVLKYNTKMKIKNSFQAIICPRLFYLEAQLQNPEGDWL